MFGGSLVTSSNTLFIVINCFQLHTTEFNTNCALHELYTYAMKYNEQLTVTLEEDEFSQKQRLAYKLEQVSEYYIIILCGKY